MNILPIQNLNTLMLNQKESSLDRAFNINFGLKMSRPLMEDTVSFKSRKVQVAEKVVNTLGQTNKKAGSYADAARMRDIKDVIEPMVQAHKDLKKKILTIFRGSIAEKERQEGSSITLLDRIKTEKSLKEKTTTVDLDEIMDPSGFAFILEDTSAFSKFSEKFTDLLKQGYSVVDYEYHRLPAKYSRGKIEKAYDSINPSSQQKLKANILKYCPKMEGKMIERDSKAGYSAVHMILKDKKGLEHELQVYIRAIADVKKVENLVYKLKNGKSIPPKFLKVSPHLSLLKPAKKGEVLSSTAKAVQEEMKGYSMDAYIDALSHPYTPNKILKPDLKKYPHLKDFDFNSLLYLFELQN